MLTIANYSVLREIGCGGMATVYLALQNSVNRQVALKVMAPSLAADRTFSERFIKEARIVAALQHPNIVAVYDVGCENHQNFIAMEYVAGGDFKFKLAHGMSVEHIFSAVLQIAKALTYAHQKGYVHRDVKTENILFRENGDAVLSDFGIAKAVVSGTKMTGTGLSIGTPQYMSPEQARGQPLDGRADFYSLGIVLFEALTGHKPFDSEDTYAIGLKHITEPIPLLPESLKKYQVIVDNLCAKNPEERYQSFEQLEQDYMAILGGQKFKRPKHATTTTINSSALFKSPLMWTFSGGVLAILVSISVYFWQESENSKSRLEYKVQESQQQMEKLKNASIEIENANQQQILALLNKAQLYLKNNNDKERHAAIEAYFKVLELDSGSNEAREGLSRIAKNYAADAEEAIKIGNLETAANMLAKGFNAWPAEPKLIHVRNNMIEKLRSEQMAFESEINRLKQLADGEKIKTERLISEQLVLSTKLDELRSLQSQGQDLKAISEQRKQLESEIARYQKRIEQQKELYAELAKNVDEVKKSKKRISPP